MNLAFRSFRDSREHCLMQDLGITRLARKIAPDIELHASTQMSITDAQGVRLAQSFGIDRVTLARELSLAETAAIAAETGCPLEIFVHGALCVAYSGQCFSSEAWGGRSANRGQCAQACRLPYGMVVDGKIQEGMGDARYLLSPGDLYALRQIPEIVKIGVAALKIEGRYKDADYVALTTHAYRQAVDEAWAGLPSALTRKEELQLEQVYSQGLGSAFSHRDESPGGGEGACATPSRRVHGTRRRCRFQYGVGRSGEAHEIAPLKSGDGVVFDCGGLAESSGAGGGRAHFRNASKARRDGGAALWEWRGTVPADSQGGSGLADKRSGTGARCANLHASRGAGSQAAGKRARAGARGSEVGLGMVGCGLRMSSSSRQRSWNRPRIAGCRQIWCGNNSDVWGIRRTVWLKLNWKSLAHRLPRCHY